MTDTAKASIDKASSDKMICKIISKVIIQVDIIRLME